MLSRLIKRLLKRLKDLLFVEEAIPDPDLEKSYVETAKPAKSHEEIMADIRARQVARKSSLPSSDDVLVELKKQSVIKSNVRPPKVISSPTSAARSPIARMSRTEEHVSTTEERVYSNPVFRSSAIQHDNSVFDIVTGLAIADAISRRDPEPVYVQPVYQPDPEPYRATEPERTYYDPEPTGSSEWSTSDSVSVSQD
jgi:hypothetical protein